MHLHQHHQHGPASTQASSPLAASSTSTHTAHTHAQRPEAIAWQHRATSTAVDTDAVLRSAPLTRTQCSVPYCCCPCPSPLPTSHAQISRLARRHHFMLYPLQPPCWHQRASPVPPLLGCSTSVQKASGGHTTGHTTQRAAGQGDLSKPSASGAQAVAVPCYCLHHTHTPTPQARCPLSAPPQHRQL
jgi:hypothetical protein